MPIASRALNRPWPDGGDDDDGQEQRRESEQDVHEAHEDVVGPARHVAGHRADRRPDEDREADRGEADDQRRPGAVDDPAEHVAEVAVGAEDVLRLVGRAAEQVDARRRPALDAGLDAEERLGRVERGDLAGEHGHEEEHREDGQPDDRGALAQDVAGGVPPQA